MVVEDFFSKEEIETVQSGILNVFDTVGRDSLDASDHNVFFNINQICCWQPSLLNLVTSNKVVNLMSQIGIKCPRMNSLPLLFLSHHKLIEQGYFCDALAHQDYIYTKGSLDSMVLWIPLCDIKEEMGFLKLVPRSHKKLLQHTPNPKSRGLPMLDFDQDAFIPVPMKMGDVLLFSTFLVHQSGKNNSEELRMSLNCRYDNIDDELFISNLLTSDPDRFTRENINGLIKRNIML